MSFGRTVTVTRKRLTPVNQSLLEMLNIQTVSLFKLRCDHIDDKGKTCSFRPEGSYEYVLSKAVTHTHETPTLESRVRWGTLSGKSRPVFRFTN